MLHSKNNVDPKKKSVNEKKKYVNTKGKKNLHVANHGDTVVIRNRSVIAAGLVGIVVLVLSVVSAIYLREAWRLPIFWFIFAALILGTGYSVAQMIFGRIVLDSPNTLLTVYSPFPKEYSFEDVNYIERKLSKGTNGAIMYTVVVYIGNGKRSVEVSSFCEAQADEIETLMRGMLKSGDITEPEADREPFNLGEDKSLGFSFLKRKRQDNGLARTPVRERSEDRSDGADTGNEKPKSSDDADMVKDEKRSEETENNE